jgi:iron complex outermembrane receptor protein
MFLRPVILSPPFGAFPVWEYQQTNARLVGIDVQTHWELSDKLQYDFALAYVNGRDLQQGISD